MADVGGHGGASIAEVMVPIVALFPQAEKDGNNDLRLVRQHDLPSTLAYLTGVPIPRNNFGVMIDELANDDPLAALYNAQQLAKLVTANRLEMPSKSK